MDYISKLSLNEQIIICHLMGGALFKEFFVNILPRDFNKIKPGFRVNKLTYAQALDTAIKNVGKAGLVRDNVNMWLNLTIDNINDCISDFERDGKTYEEAVPMALVDSKFVNNIDLYFKLIEKDISDKKLFHIKQEIQKERLDITVTDDKISALKERIKELEDELERANADYRKISEDKERIISNYEIKIADLSDKLQYAEEKIKVNSNIISDEQQLLQNEDKAPEGLQVQDSEEIISLCKTSTDYKQNTWLIRLADIDYHGYLSQFHRDENKPLLFNNRDKLFYRDGPKIKVWYAVWNWTAIPNENDSKKDYVTTKFNDNIVPIEIIKLTECNSIESIISVLKNGHEVEIHSKKIMFVISNQKGIYEGILCKEKDIEKRNHVLSLLDSVIQLPVYEFQMNDTITIDDGIIFFRKVYAGVPSRLYRVKNNTEIVKKIVLDSISWSTYKTRCTSKKEYQCFRKIIGSISSDDIIKKIELACNCNNKIAAELLEQFISKISDYLNEDSLEDDVLKYALNSNDTLMNRTKNLIMDEWKTENNELINHAKSELEEVIKKKNSASDELDKIKTDCKKIKEEIEFLSFDLAEKEKLASDIEIAIEDKIKNAQLKAANFIADMAFVYPAMPLAETTPTASFEITELFFDENEASKHNNWKDIIETLEIELGEAGICSDYFSGLATFLCASYIAKEPLFLIGPNSDSIVEAFTISLFGGNLGVLNCQGKYTKSFLCNSDYYKVPIVMIKNIISSRWIEYLPELLNNHKPYYFITHPYAEDIQIESKSLYNYVLPLFTDFFVEHKATKNYYGGYRSDDFQDYNCSTIESYKIVRKLSANKFVKTRLNKILTIMHSINPNLSKDDDFIYGILQYAYATLDYESIKVVLEDNESAVSNKLKSDFKYILGEIE